MDWDHAAEEHKYDDIRMLVHHRSRVHPPMSLWDRAAQFSPFAALSGHEDAIRETARLTTERIELSESRKEELNEQLVWLRQNPMYVKCRCTPPLHRDVLSRQPVH